MSENSEAQVLLVAGRECGPCSLCCKVLTIEFMNPPKPGGRWCQHCRPGNGCAIWQDRPKGCIDFHCDWRRNPLLGDDWRPDRAGFMINQAGEDLPFEVVVDPGRPDAWRKEPYYSRLKKAAAAALDANKIVLVVVGARRWVMLPDEDVPAPPDAVGREIRIIREKLLVGEKIHVRFGAAKPAA